MKIKSTIPLLFFRLDLSSLYKWMVSLQMVRSLIEDVVDEAFGRCAAIEYRYVDRMIHAYLSIVQSSHSDISYNWYQYCQRSCWRSCCGIPVSFWSNNNYKMSGTPTADKRDAKSKMLEHNITTFIKHNITIFIFRQCKS
jgi:hypothetical protein